MQKTLTLTFFILVAVLYLFKSFEFSRLAFFYFLTISFLGLISARSVLRNTLKMLRKRGYNQRHAIIGGTGEIGQKILEKIELYPELGIQVLGFLTGKAGQVGEAIRDIPIIGVYEDVNKILDEKKLISF